MNYVFIIANYAAFLIAKNAAPLLPFLLHSKLPKVVYSENVHVQTVTFFYSLLVILFL